MSKRESKLLLLDILDSITKIKTYTSGYTFEAFIADTRTCDAVVSNFEIIGEAQNRLPDLKTFQISLLLNKRKLGNRSISLL